jgi:hypothetical protein
MVLWGKFFMGLLHARVKHLFEISAKLGFFDTLCGQILENILNSY